METLDPATGRSLGSDAIQRVLFIAGSVHVYNIPPMTPGKGHVAASWTADGNKNQIFTARMRVIETSITPPEGGDDKVKTDIVLEDPSTGQLFAAAPYVAQAVVEPASDSSRFFALRVQDDAGRKATLGVGFEDRGEAFDFGVSLQEAQKSLGWDRSGPPGKKPAAQTTDSSSAADKRDLSLKEGETITVNLPSRFGRRKPDPPQSSSSSSSAADGNLASFSIPPPPPSASGNRGSVILPPPPSASGGSGGSRERAPSAADLGFDDGKFGEFA